MQQSAAMLDHVRGMGRTYDPDRNRIQARIHRRDGRLIMFVISGSLRSVASWRDRRTVSVLTCLDRPDLMVEAGHEPMPRYRQVAFGAAWWMRFHAAAG
jgi:hypothetical protein